MDEDDSLLDDIPDPAIMASLAKSVAATSEAQTAVYDTHHRELTPSPHKATTTTTNTTQEAETYTDAWTNMKEVETTLKEISSTYNEMFVDFKLMVGKTNTLMQQNQQLLEHLKRKSKAEKSLLESFGHGLEHENERLKAEVKVLREALERENPGAVVLGRQNDGDDGRKGGKTVAVWGYLTEGLVVAVLGGAVAAAIVVLQAHPVSKDDPVIQLAGPFGLILLGIWLHVVLRRFVIRLLFNYA